MTFVKTYQTSVYTAINLGILRDACGNLYNDEVSYFEHENNFEPGTGRHGWEKTNTGKMPVLLQRRAGRPRKTQARCLPAYGSAFGLRAVECDQGLCYFLNLQADRQFKAIGFHERSVA